MRSHLVMAAVLALSAAAGSAQTKLDVKDIENHPFAADFNSGGKLRMYLQSGDFRIEGSESNKITVRIRGGNAYRAADMRVRLEGSNDDANLTVSGGPKDDLQVTIEVPRQTSLFVRMPAGNLELRHIVGNKDAELRAGEMIIEVGNAGDYSHVDASVYSGGLEASPFGEDHGGLFRSFHKEGNGKYHLHAHVGAGDLTLR
ncbi:MAG: hypothetical protein ACRD51_03985 [Candidatus Acidiferrum sp.]